MNVVKSTVVNVIASAAVTAGSIIGLGVGAVLFNEKIEPWMVKKLHKDSK